MPLALKRPAIRYLSSYPNLSYWYHIPSGLLAFSSPSWCFNVLCILQLSLSVLGVSVMVIGYLSIGAAVFQSLEGGQQTTIVTKVSEVSNHLSNRFIHSAWIFFTDRQKHRQTHILTDRLSQTNISENIPLPWFCGIVKILTHTHFISRYNYTSCNWWL